MTSFIKKKYKKAIVSLLAFVMPFTQIVPYPVAYAISFMTPKTAYAETAHAVTAEALTAYASTIPRRDPPNDISTVYDLVAIIVDTRLDSDNTPYVGLFNQFPGLSQTTIGARIMRYAEDVVENNPLTDAKILFYDSATDSVHDIASALENLYINGDGTRNNRLAGVVLVGDIPLPVVNKNGNSYVSVFPYTDLVDKAYTYVDSRFRGNDNGGNDPAERDGDGQFVRNENVTFPKPEIWHGIIKAPDDTAAGKQKLAEYFDKNHLYHSGDEEFADFDKKLFVGDLIHEEEKISPDIYKYYLKYLEGLEDLAYMRYNKYWANAINSDQMADIPADEGSVGGQMLEDIQSGDAMAQTPDIYTKYIIDNSLTPYVKLLGSYVAKINDWIDYTGRYKTTDVLNVPVLVTMKDEYAKAYLKVVNDALEKKINQIVGTIQEPIPLLESARISGSVDDTPFRISLNESDGRLPPNMYSWDVDNDRADLSNNFVEALYYRFHYKNDVNGDLYINGVDAKILDSPKQCSVYLGSTKNEYFDSDLNFNPTDGRYSVMTRAMRSNDVSTAKGVHTTGVNTRLLSPKETYVKTGGAYGATIVNGETVYGTYSGGLAVSGAVVEDKPAYGISAFEPNPMTENYVNVLEEKGLRKGDVIIGIDYADLRGTESFYQTLSSYTTFDVAIENVYQKAKAATTNDDKNITGTFVIYFLRGSSMQTVTATFTATKNSELASKRSDSEVPVPLPSDGAIFTLYTLRTDGGDDSFLDDHSGDEGVEYGNGYGGQGYDNSAGCNFMNTLFYSDRCFYPFATIPVLDPAGSVALERFENPSGGSDRLKFPENFSQDPETSGDLADHTDMFPYPSTKRFNQIDDVYLNSCYHGYSAFDTSNEEWDSNGYDFPIDPETFTGFPEAGDYVSALLAALTEDVPLTTEAIMAVLFSNSVVGIDKDVYGRFLNGVGNFLKKGDSDDDSWELSVITEDPDTGETDTHTQNLSGADMKVPPSEGDVWNPIKNLTANSIVLNSTPAVKLKAFSDRYGIFDGIDNDGDGLMDSADLVDESRTEYGINSNDLDEIARKLFSKTKTYTIPAVVSPLTGKSITLNVTANTYSDNPSVPSTILHNEPTPYTIFEQVKSGTALSLPIDNPRYVAFQSKPLGDQTVGKIEKIYYPDLFEIPNYAQLIVNMDSLATRISGIPGANRLGVSGQRDIHDRVYRELLNVVSGTGLLDYPTVGSEIAIASSEKVYDAISWFHSNIDEKHKYILKYYLNPNEEAFIKDSVGGFEAAYLVLDGKDNSFNLSFNKDLAEENDPMFDPLNISYTGGGDGGDGSGGADEEVVGEEEDVPENFFVPLPQFLDDARRI
ncbi:MAG: hypothetical protein WC285_02630, partial [Candidatus Gracilibacteria bacterium]